MSWVRCGTKDDTAPLSVINFLRKNDIAFFDVVRLGSDGETNRQDGVNSTERAALLRQLIARTGQRTHSGRSPTKSARDWNCLVAHQHKFNPPDIPGIHKEFSSPGHYVQVSHFHDPCT